MQIDGLKSQRVYSELQLHFNLCRFSYIGHPSAQKQSAVSSRPLHFVFGIQKLKTKTIFNVKNPKWILNRTFDLTVSSFDDFDRKLCIRLFSTKQKYLGNISVSFFELAVSTIRNNFVFNSNSRYLGRMQFDIKISQIVEMKIRCDKMTVQVFDFYQKFNIKNFDDMRFIIFVDQENVQPPKDRFF